MKTYLYESDCFNPYENLAVERYLFRDSGVILYLWQNEKTVVIGRNQNYRAECNVSIMEADGAALARRLSGGGAVYHDSGNVNFSFIAPKEFYDVNLQLNIITAAVNSFDIPRKAERTGRNDIEINGAKFSGNAYINGGEYCCHHGTILIKTDFEKMARYLNPSAEKLASKGVKSVKARVVNLSEVCADITVASMKNALRESFSKEYGGDFEVISADAFDKLKIAEYRGFFASDKWLYNDCKTYRFSVKKRLSDGNFEIGFDTDNNGRVSAVQVFSDALETDTAKKIKNALLGQEMNAESAETYIDLLLEL